MRELSQMTLQEKIGQMFVCGFHGHTSSKEILYLIEKYHLGGVIYFSRNIGTVQEVHALSVELQEAAVNISDIPLLISIDQEGGMVARLVEGVTLMPGSMAFGATRDAAGVYAAAKACGEELRALGINMNFAPSLDINNNPKNPVINVRSFGDSAAIVSELGIQVVLGYQAAGVAATVKHFPGHGDTETDSHRDLPVINQPLQRLQELELVPFRQAVAAGIDAVMTAHVVLPALDDTGTPSTLSQPILTGLLREELGYDGVVVTDCLEMKAIDMFFGAEKAAVLAVEAGVDQVLVVIRSRNRSVPSKH